MDTNNFGLKTEPYFSEIDFQKVIDRLQEDNLIDKTEAADIRSIHAFYKYSKDFINTLRDIKEEE